VDARDLKAYVERGWAAAQTRKQEHLLDVNYM